MDNDTTDRAHRNMVEQMVRLSIRVADCLKTATLCGRGLGSEFRREAKEADAALREFIAESTDQREPCEETTMTERSEPKRANRARFDAIVGEGFKLGPIMLMDAFNIDFTVCGTATRRGTPCQRKVKPWGPCWQHKPSSARIKWRRYETPSLANAMLTVSGVDSVART